MLAKQKKYEESICHYREVLRLKPNLAKYHSSLGIVYSQKGDYALAVAAHREAIRIDPKVASFHKNLGDDLTNLNRLDEAIAAYHEAIRWQSDDSKSYNNLGNVLIRCGDFDGAIVAARQAIQIESRYVLARINLGTALLKKDESDAAVAAFREAIQLEPENFFAHYRFGCALRSLGNFSGSLEQLRRAHELALKDPDDPQPDSADWVREAERMLELSGQLSSIVARTAEPKNAADRLIFARMCFDTRRYATAARLWGVALEHDRTLGDDLNESPLYHAACAALLAAAGKGRNEDIPDRAARPVLRDQALKWLAQERDFWRKRETSENPSTRADVTATYLRWRYDPDLMSVRDSAALAELSEKEQNAWESFWKSLPKR